MKYCVTLILLIVLAIPAFSQQLITVKGTVKNAEGKALPKASVILYYKGSKDSLKTLTADNGDFSFNAVKPTSIGIQVSYVGYSAFMNAYDFSGTSGIQQATGIVLIPGNNTLENVTLESSKIQIKEDTVSYVVDSTMYRKNDNVEEVLKKLPGVQVDKDGTVTAQGKQVTKVKVNGKEFFGGDVTTATRELNADMVDKIQIIDDYGDQSAFTGIKDGDPSKTLNIQLKKDRNKGYFGNLTAGAGTEDRYVTSLSVNKFNNNQQISILGNLNNTNASLFNFGSIGGSMGNMISSMARGMGIGQGGGGVASALGNLGASDGIGTTKSIGLNYRDEWGKKVSVYGSYSFSEKGTSTLKDITQQNSFQNLTNINTRKQDDYTVADNHRFSFNLEYKIDSFNYLKVNPSVTYRKSATRFVSTSNITDAKQNLLNEGNIFEIADSKSPNFNGNILFNHRFHKKGRTLSVNVNAGRSSTEGTDDIENDNTYYFNGNIFDSSYIQQVNQDNNNHSYGIRTSYVEPLSKKRSLEFNYAYNRQYTGNDKKTYAIDPQNGGKTYVDTLSNIYDNVYTTNRFGVNFRTTEKKYNYTIGLAVQPATISSNTLTGIKTNYTQHLVNYYPVIRFAYNFSRSRSFNLNYNGSTSQPSFSQLQPVADVSNPQYITIGNPDLKPEFTNTFSMRYNNFDFISGNVFFGNVLFSFTKDKIVTNTTPIGFSSQETRYLNSDGFFTASGFYNISRPKQNRKYVFNLGGNLTYNNNVSYLKGEKNIGRNWVFAQRLAVDIKIKKWLETSAGVNYALNTTKYSISSSNLQNLNTNAWSLSHSSRIFFPADIIFSYDLDKTINSGYAGNVNANPLIINSTLEKQLFKKKNASIKLQAYDLLNENTSISRSVTAQSITDTRTNRLGRYLMLSFVLRLNKFSGQQPAMSMPGGGNMQMMRPPGM